MRGLPNKTLHTNRRPALDFGLSVGLFDADWPDYLIVRAAGGDRWAAAHRAIKTIIAYALVVIGIRAPVVLLIGAPVGIPVL